LVAERLKMMSAPWRHRCELGGGPEVFADLDAEERAVDVEEEVGSNWNVALSAEGAGAWQTDGGGGEPAGLVEFVVVGNVCLGNDAQDVSLLQYDGHVEQV
jgi:hypothetical protein